MPTPEEIAAQQAAEEAERSGQAPPEQKPAESKPSGEEARIADLVRERNNLQRLLEQSMQMGQQQNHQEEKPKLDPDQEKWLPWIQPKVDPIFQEKLAPYQRAIYGLADRIDLLDTALEFPEYKEDPAVQQEVEAARAEIKRRTNQDFSRKDVMTYLKGQKARDPKYLEAEAEKILKKRQAAEAQKSSAFVHTDATLGISGVRPPKPLKDMELSELEKFLGEKDVRG